MMKYLSLFFALAFIGMMVIAEVRSDPVPDADADPFFLGFGGGFRRGGFGREGGFGRRYGGFGGRYWG